MALENLIQRACHWERHTPDDVCMTQPGGSSRELKTWTWKQMMHEVRSMAAYLKGLNLPEHSNVALFSKNCAHWIMADLAVWMAGHVSVPIFTTLNPDGFQYIFRHCEAKCLFFGRQDPGWQRLANLIPEDFQVVAFPGSPENNFNQWEDIVASNRPMEEPVLRDGATLATIIYTSGSTGTPKGVMISFQSMYRCAEIATEHFNISSHDRLISYLPLAHVFERFLIESQSLFSGIPVYFNLGVDTFVDDLQKARPTVFYSVPRLWFKFREAVLQKIPSEELARQMKDPVKGPLVKQGILNQLGLDRTRFCGSGSAPLPVEILEWYRQLGLDLAEGYGMTENFAFSHSSLQGQMRAGFVGIPYPGVTNRLSKDGEVLVKSPGNMMGYYKMPDETRAVFTRDGFLRTGDLGQFDIEGRLKITGRVKELFKTSKGKYVAPAPIEILLGNHPLVETGFVSGASQPRPFGVVVLSDDTKKTLAGGGKASVEKALIHLLKEVNSRLSPHEHLAFIAVSNDAWSIENGCLTPTLKIKRSVLEDRYSQLSVPWYESGKPVIWQS